MADQGRAFMLQAARTELANKIPYHTSDIDNDGRAADYFVCMTSQGDNSYLVRENNSAHRWDENGIDSSQRV